MLKKSFSILFLFIFLCGLVHPVTAKEQNSLHHSAFTLKPRRPNRTFTPYITVSLHDYRSWLNGLRGKFNKVQTRILFCKTAAGPYKEIAKLNQDHEFSIHLGRPYFTIEFPKLKLEQGIYKFEACITNTDEIDVNREFKVDINFGLFSLKKLYYFKIPAKSKGTRVIQGYLHVN